MVLPGQLSSKHETILQQPWRDHVGWRWLAFYEEPQSEWLARPWGHGHSGSEHFRHVSTVRMVERGWATACLRRDNSSGTLGKMIQSVRLARQRALFLPLCRLFVFVQSFTRPVSVPNCLSPLPHKFGPAAVAVALLKLTAAPLFTGVFIHHSQQFQPTRANVSQQTFTSSNLLSWDFCCL